MRVGSKYIIKSSKIAGIYGGGIGIDQILKLEPIRYFLKCEHIYTPDKMFIIKFTAWRTDSVRFFLHQPD